MGLLAYLWTFKVPWGLTPKGIDALIVRGSLWLQHLRRADINVALVAAGNNRWLRDSQTLLLKSMKSVYRNTAAVLLYKIHLIRSDVVNKDVLRLHIAYHLLSPDVIIKGSACYDSFHWCIVTKQLNWHDCIHGNIKYKLYWVLKTCDFPQMCGYISDTIKDTDVESNKSGTGQAPLHSLDNTVGFESPKKVLHYWCLSVPDLPLRRLPLLLHRHHRHNIRI